jgi:tetratricopeptide (TPR) repeat protein
MTEELSIAHDKIAEGESSLQDGRFQEAMEIFNDAKVLFESAGDDKGALRALSKYISVFTAQGCAEEAVAMAEERKVQFQARGNINGEICMYEQIINAHFAREDPSAAAAAAKKAIGQLKKYETCGMETLSGQAFMWLTIGQASLKNSEYDDAMEAAETATKMFSDIGEYDHESLAVKLYNAASDQKGKNTYVEAEKQNFYLGVRVGGIAYGPRYRDNQVISVKPSGCMHVATCLQLCCQEGEEWEHDVAYHAGMIDAAAHASFANSARPDFKAAAEEAAKDPNYRPEGPSIPFLMDHGELRQRPSTSDMYVSIASNHIYVVSN